VLTPLAWIQILYFPTWFCGGKERKEEKNNFGIWVLFGLMFIELDHREVAVSVRVGI